MNKITAYIILAICSFLPATALAVLPTDNLQAADNSLKTAVIDSVTGKYFNWGRVTLNGKITSPKIPVSVNVKIAMEKDKLTIITLAAPILGEVGRVELEQTGATIVNKIDRVYSRVSFADLEAIYPGGQTDLQNMILGRITIMGKGALRKLSTADVEVYDGEPGKYIIMPNQNLQPKGMSYLYTVGKENYLPVEFIMVPDEGSNEVLCNYSWAPDGGYAMSFETTFDNNPVSGTLTFNAPKWGAATMERFEPSDRYREVTIKELFTRQ